MQLNNQLCQMDKLERLNMHMKLMKKVDEKVKLIEK